jgi:hypothetical protein
MAKRPEIDPHHATLEQARMSFALQTIGLIALMNRHNIDHFEVDPINDPEPARQNLRVHHQGGKILFVFED